MKQLENYIHVFPNIVPDDLCDLVISEYKQSDKWKDATFGSTNIDKSVRNCQFLNIPPSDIDKSIFECAAEALKKYIEVYPGCRITEDSGYNLLKYTEGGFYIQHVDANVEYNRSVSCSFILNDGFEGGEFAFFDRELQYKIPKGSAIMFPSNFMYPHEVMPVISGTRYSIITWFR